MKTYEVLLISGKDFYTYRQEANDEEEATTLVKQRHNSDDLEILSVGEIE